MKPCQGKDPGDGSKKPVGRKYPIGRPFKPRGGAKKPTGGGTNGFGPDIFGWNSFAPDQI